MTKRVHFTKMHGAGNDYIYVNTLLYNIADPTEAARRWSAPHTGIGSDGLVLIGASPVPEADFSMHIYNADGSEAMMCGNASRCIGKYLYEKGMTAKTEIRLLTLSGIRLLKLEVKGKQVASVTVDMGEPVLTDDRFFIPTGSLPTGTFVSMGNPHYVVFTDEVDAIAKDGPALECHPAFPQRCNIEYASVQADGTIRMRVWERGSGITKACGTGACATAVAAVLQKAGNRRNTIVMDGGRLDIVWDEKDNHIYMTGPATFVYEGDIDL